MLLKLDGLSFLLTTDCVGGVFTQTVMLARDLVTRGANVIIATLGPQPRTDQIADIVATGAEWLPLVGALDWMASHPDDIRQTAEAIARVARQRRVTSVHLHAPAYAAFDFDWPHIAACHSCHATWWATVHPHQPLPADLAWRAHLTREGLIRAHDTIAPSHSFAGALFHTYRLARRPISIPNGVQDWSAEPAASRRGTVTVGRFWDEAKNLPTLVDIARQLTHDIMAIGPMPDRFEATPHLVTPGSVSQSAVRGRLNGARVFISAAIYEPFGLAALEAAQSGLALVLSDIPAHRENWDGVALFRPAHDASGFAEILNRLHAHPEEAEERGAAARQHASRFDPSQMGEATALTHLNPRKGAIAA